MTFRLLLTFLLTTYAVLAGWPGIKGMPDTARTEHGTGPFLPYTIHSLDLGKVEHLVRGGIEPETHLAFSLDGSQLAVATATGDLIILDVSSGEKIFSRKIPEGFVKKVAWSADGKILFSGEQSPDGTIAARNPINGDIIWSFDLSTDLGASEPPAPDDIYGMFRFPGCYQLKALQDGGVLALGLHAWGVFSEQATMKRLSRVYRFSSTGKLLWAYPQKTPAYMSLVYADSDPAGRRVAILTGMEAGVVDNRPEQIPAPPGSLLVLNGETGERIGSHTFQPLRPYFDAVGFWQSVSVSKNGKQASIGMHDGRAFLLDLDTVELTHTFSFGKPMLISGVPVSARASWSHLASNGIAYFQTGDTNVPNASAMDHVVQPPGPHPHANTIDAIDAESGKTVWRYRSGHAYQNFWTSQDGRWLMTTARKSSGKQKEASILLFDTHRSGGGSRKLVYKVPVQGMLFYQAAMSPDGSILAYIEIPYLEDENGSLRGSYKLHLTR